MNFAALVLAALWPLGLGTLAVGALDLGVTYLSPDREDFRRPALAAIGERIRTSPASTMSFPAVNASAGIQGTSDASQSAHPSNAAPAPDAVRPMPPTNLRVQ